MSTPVKLYERERNVLKLEEEVLQNMIFEYQSALNALKVEELTLTNRLGQSQDRARQSLATTPTSLQLNSNALGNLPTLVSKVNASDFIYKPSPLQVKNKRSIKSFDLNSTTKEATFLEEEMAKEHEVEFET